MREWLTTLIADGVYRAMTRYGVEQQAAAEKAMTDLLRKVRATHLGGGPPLPDSLFVSRGGQS